MIVSATTPIHGWNYSYAYICGQHRDLFWTHNDEYMIIVMYMCEVCCRDCVVISLTQSLGDRFDNSIELVARPNEGCGKNGIWVTINFLWLIKLLDLAFCHHRNTIRDCQCLFLVVCDVDGGHLELLLNTTNFVTQ